MSYTHIEFMDPQNYEPGLWRESDESNGNEEENFGSWQNEDIPQTVTEQKHSVVDEIKPTAVLHDLRQTIHKLEGESKGEGDSKNKSLFLTTELYGAYLRLRSFLESTDIDSEYINFVNTRLVELERLDGFPRDYSQIVKFLKRVGLLRVPLSSKDYSISGIDAEHPEKAREYPLPSFEQVQAAFREHASELEPKIQQGFNRLLLVPIASPLERLKDTYAQALKTHYKQRKLLDSEGKPAQLNNSEPVWAWDGYNNADVEGKLVYYPKSFDQNHGGITKPELIGQTLTEFPGWQVRLVEDLPNLPAQGKGQTIGGRKQVEAGLTPREYLKQPQTDPQYSGEDGATPEEWLTQAIVHLETTNQVFDDYQGKGKLSFLTGSYFPRFGGVQGACWSRYDRQACLGRDDPGDRDEDYSARRSVRVGKRKSFST